MNKLNENYCAGAETTTRVVIGTHVTLHNLRLGASLFANEHEFQLKIGLRISKLENSN